MAGICNSCKQWKEVKEDIRVKGKSIKVYLFCNECYKKEIKKFRRD